MVGRYFNPIDVAVECGFHLSSQMSSPRGCINSLGFSGDGELLAAAGDDLAVRVWRCREGYTSLNVLQSNHGGNIFASEFAPHRNDLIATCAADGRVQVLTTERPDSPVLRLFTAHSNMAHSLAFPFQHSCILCSVGSDGLCLVHDLRCPVQQDASGHSATTGAGLS